MSEGARTLVLGFDAMDERYLDRFAEHLPTLSRLRSEGVEASLSSTDPPWTASAWPSMYTGTDPSHHGVYGFFDYDYPDEGRIVTRNDVDAPAIWNYLTARGVPAAVMNVPVTHPAEPIDGTLVPGYLAGEDAAGHPEGIRDELSAAIGEDYRIYSTGEVSSDPEAKLAGYLDLIDRRKRAAVSLLTDHEWEVGVVQVQKTDAVFHNFDDEAAFRAIYEAADEFAAAVLDAVDGPVNVVVCSDHGMGKKTGYQIQVNDVLRRAGYVEAAPDASQVTLGTEKRERLLDDGRTPGDGADHTGDDGDSGVGGDGRGTADSTGSSLVTDGVATAQRILGRVGVTPGRVYGLAERVGAGGLLIDVIPDSVTVAAGEGVDWRASRAYCRSASRLGVRINLAGREPDGVVPADEYEQVRADLIDLLSALETPDGEPAFEAVLPREDVYDGPHADGAPDVVLRPNGAHHILSTRLYDRSFVAADLYDHDPTGIFVGHGPAFADDAAPERLSLTDVAPIVMALAGLPVPDRMTGYVPPGLLAEPVATADYGDVPFGTDRVVADAREEVTDALADLGYL